MLNWSALLLATVVGCCASSPFHGSLVSQHGTGNCCPSLLLLREDFGQVLLADSSAIPDANGSNELVGTWNKGNQRDSRSLHLSRHHLCSSRILSDRQHM